jgi:hypothetical protein
MRRQTKARARMPVPGAHIRNRVRSCAEADGPERRIAAIKGMRRIDTDTKTVILGLANLLRNSPPHPRIRWPVRSRNTRKLAVVMLRTVMVVSTNDEQPPVDDEMFELMQALFQH